MAFKKEPTPSPKKEDMSFGSPVKRVHFEPSPITSAWESKISAAQTGCKTRVFLWFTDHQNLVVIFMLHRGSFHANLPREDLFGFFQTT